MNQSVVYLGADVSKATIDCRILEQSFAITNDGAGFAQFAKRLAPLAKRLTQASIHVICEATGAIKMPSSPLCTDKGSR
jgi:hypothetical protein